MGGGCLRAEVEVRSGEMEGEVEEDWPTSITEEQLIPAYF